MIRGKNVVLRTLRESDLEALFNFYSDFALTGEYSTRVLRSESKLKKEFHENGLMSDERSTLAMCVDGQMIGTVVFFKVLYHDSLEVGYVIYDPAMRNKGYATEALGLLTEYLFSSVKINRLQLEVVEGNLASRRVAEKCGFQLEGVLRGAIFHRGKNHNLQLFSLLRDDCA